MEGCKGKVIKTIEFSKENEHMLRQPLIFTFKVNLEVPVQVKYLNNFEERLIRSLIIYQEH